MADRVEQRRLVALTVELVRRGELPAFYASPPERTRMERALQRKLAAELSGFAGKLLDGLDGNLFGPSNDAMITAALADDVEIATDAIQGAYESAYLQTAKDSFEKQAVNILRDADIALDWNQVAPQAQRILKEQSFTASKKLMDRVVGDVDRVLLKGFEEGLGTKEIGQRLGTVIQNLRSKEAEGIARTEVNSAGNTGNFIALQTANVEYMQWITASDGRVRETHMLQHGLVVKTEERFPNGLLFPGDKSGSIDEWINCRCAGIAYFPTKLELLKDTPYVGTA